MRKTLIFKNIKQPQQRESWDQTKLILANKILNVMPELDKDFITKKIESAHRVKGTKYGTILPVVAKFSDLPVIAKFSDWTFPEQVKPSFIKVAKDKKVKSPSQCHKCIQLL